MKRVPYATCKKIAVHMCRLRNQVITDTSINNNARTIQLYFDIEVATRNAIEQEGISIDFIEEQESEKAA